MSSDEGNAKGGGGISSAPFLDYALLYLNLGCSIIPCGGENGKRPLRKWTPYQRYLPFERVLSAWQSKHPSANIGLITGAVSGVTVIDCDDKTRTPESLQKEYGRTPFIVRTHSGGHHLYYRFNAEQSHTGYKDNIDIRGNGGLIIAPYSVSPITGNAYEIIKGTLDDLRRLPLMHEGAYKPQAIKAETAPKAQSKPIKDKDDCEYRNNSLYIYLKNIARHIADIEILKSLAIDFNQSEFKVPLPNYELNATVRSVWKYKLENRLLDGSKIYTLSKEHFDKLKDNPAALVLYMDLLYNHFDRPDFFIITTADCMPKRMGWGVKKLRAAIKILLERGYIKKVGERKPEDSDYPAHVYVFNHVPKDT